MARTRAERFTVVLRWLLPVLYGVGVVGHWFEGTRPLILALTPWFLTLVATLLLLAIFRAGMFSKRFLIWIIAAYLFTMVIEAIGVKTGQIFGHYWYGQTLGLKIFEVPFVIGINWLLVAWGGYTLAAQRLSKQWQRVIVGSLCVVLFDIIMEPVAVSLNYWQWRNAIIPVQNYFAWFVVSVVVLWFIPRQKYPTVITVDWWCRVGFMLGLMLGK